MLFHGLVHQSGNSTKRDAVLNAANEVAVQAFLDNRIPFGGIPRLVNQAMEEHALDPGAELEAILEADAWARRRTEEEIPNLR